MSDSCRFSGRSNKRTCYISYGLEQNKKIAKMGGNTAKIATSDLKNKLKKQ